MIKAEKTFTQSLVHISYTRKTEHYPGRVGTDKDKSGSVVSDGLYRQRMNRDKLNTGRDRLGHDFSVGNNPMVGMTVAVAVSIQEASDNGQW